MSPRALPSPLNVLCGRNKVIIISEKLPCPMKWKSDLLRFSLQCGGHPEETAHHSINLMLFLLKWANDRLRREPSQINEIDGVLSWLQRPLNLRLALLNQIYSALSHRCSGLILSDLLFFHTHAQSAQTAAVFHARIVVLELHLNKKQHQGEQGMFQLQTSCSWHLNGNTVGIW